METLIAFRQILRQQPPHDPRIDALIPQMFRRLYQNPRYERFIGLPCQVRWFNIVKIANAVELLERTFSPHRFHVVSVPILAVAEDRMVWHPFDRHR